MDQTIERNGPRQTSRFIPLSRQAVIADLCARAAASEVDSEALATVALRLQRYRARGYRALTEEMRRSYLPFSPDRDTLRVLEFSPEERERMGDRLAHLTRHLLERANYRAITTDELDKILAEEAPYSLRISVDLAEYDELQLYARETYTRRHSVRRPDRLYLVKAHYQIRVFRRLFVFLKLKSDEDRAREIAEAEGISLAKAQKRVTRIRANLPPSVAPEYIYIKVFKDMSEHDLDILFPLRKVQFRPFDKIKFFATAGGGTLFGVFTTTGKVLAATNPFALLGAFIGFVGLLARQIKTFFNQRTRYMMELSQKLFFHNLANNRAALALLLDRAEEEDIKEDLIALYFHAGETIPRRELAARKSRIDALILERYGAAIDFEIDDTLSRLTTDGIVTEEGDALRFATLPEAAAIYERLLASEDSDALRHICDPDPTPTASQEA